MTKTLNQIIFFFLHQNQNIFFSNIGNQNTVNCAKLKVNIDKTKIIVFSTSQTAENVHFLYDEKEIETVTEFNYLGVTFTKN